MFGWKASGDAAEERPLWPLFRDRDGCGPVQGMCPGSPSLGHKASSEPSPHTGSSDEWAAGNGVCV